MIEREKSNKHWLSAAERVARIKRGNHISAENCTEWRKNVNPQIQEAGESQPSQLNKNKTLWQFLVKLKDNRGKGGRKPWYQSQIKYELPEMNSNYTDSWLFKNSNGRRHTVEKWLQCAERK